MAKTRILLDTDIGSDIDDAMALAYLLKHPNCELLGITTVSGDVQRRAALADVLCRAAHKPHVPIHCGRREVLTHGLGQPRVPQFAAIEHLHPRLDRPENTAVEFLRHTIRAHPGEVTLLSIGPYSNIAILFAIDPEIPFLLKSFVSMAGVFYGGDRREWNALVDPTATSIVYNSPRKSHVSVGLDVTEHCRLGADEVRRRFVGEPLATVRSMAETWFQQVKEATFHDPLAAALIFRPDLCEYESGRVESPLTADLNSCGHTVLHPGEGPDKVAKSVRVEAFFEEYFSITTSDK